MFAGWALVLATTTWASPPTTERCDGLRWEASGELLEAGAPGCAGEALTGLASPTGHRVGVWPHPTTVTTPQGVLEGVAWRSDRRRPKLRPAPAVRVAAWRPAEVAGSEGWRCEVAVAVDASGEVQDASSACEGALGQASADAARGWSFEPLQVDGEAVAFETTVTVPVEPVRSTVWHTAPSPWLGYEPNSAAW